MTTSKLRVLVALAMALLIAVPTLFAQTVVRRARLGSNTEDITYVNSETGPLARTMVVLDGYDVLGAKVAKGSHRPLALKKLFDVRNLPFASFPRGVTWATHNGRFYFTDPGAPGQLVMVSDTGQSLGALAVTFPAPPAGTSLVGLEGLGYVPSDAAMYANQLVVAANLWDSNLSQYVPHVYVVSPADGTTSLDVAIALPNAYITGVAAGVLDFDGIDHGGLFISVGNEIYFANPDGSVPFGPIAVPEAGDLEGLVQADNDYIWAADYTIGKLMCFTRQQLARIAAKDRAYKIGIGISVPVGVGWNARAKRHELTTLSGELRSITVSLLGPAKLVKDFSAIGKPFVRAVTYLPGEKLTAVLNTSPSEILLVNKKGEISSILPLPLVPGATSTAAAALSFIPSSNQFVARVAGINTTLHYLSRLDASYDGSMAPLTDPDIVANRITAVEYFVPTGPGGTAQLFIAARDKLFVYGMDGTQLKKLDTRTAFGAFSVSDVSYVTNGAQKNSFVAIDPNNSEIIVFKW